MSGGHRAHRKKGSKNMMQLKHGEHTTFTSSNGVTYWVMNLRGRYHVEKLPHYGVTVRATKEIMKAIKLI